MWVKIYKKWKLRFCVFFVKFYLGIILLESRNSDVIFFLHSSLNKNQKVKTNNQKKYRSRNETYNRTFQKSQNEEEHKSTKDGYKLPDPTEVGQDKEAKPKWLPVRMRFDNRDPY